MPDFATRGEVRDVYRRRAQFYDISANLFYLIGFREYAYRVLAVEALNVKLGDTVVEIGCGTGLNFALLQARVGPQGRIIGVDLTDAMLAEAAARCQRHGWSNVELVQSDAAAYRFPDSVDGVLSTFALTLEPEYDTVVARGAMALEPGRRWVLLDLKLPSNPWLRRIAPALVLLARPFAVSLAIAKRHPWESFATYLSNVTMRELYFGFAYLAIGEAPRNSQDGRRRIDV